VAQATQCLAENGTSHGIVFNSEDLHSGIASRHRRAAVRQL
jgi:hypothetical protein